MFQHPDNMMLLARARERDARRLLPEPPPGTSDEAGWRSTGEEVLFRYTIAMPGPEPAVFSMLARVVAAVRLRLRRTRAAGHPVPANEAVTVDGA